MPKDKRIIKYHLQTILPSRYKSYTRTIEKRFEV